MIERRAEAELLHHPPEQPEPDDLDGLGRRLLEEYQGFAQQVEGGRPGFGRRHPADDLREGGGGGVAVEVAGQREGKVEDVERGQGVEVAAFGEQQLRLPGAEELKRGAEPAPGTKRTLRDRALDAVIARGQAHDLRGLAVADGGEDDGGRGDQRHGVTWRVALSRRADR